LRALQHAHDKGIVHRDVKPQNIMLLSDGTIKVTDFGIARFARSNQNTLSDKAIGSVHYISPEQARGDNIDEKADLYSVGVMMYEMLTGKLPFDGGNAVSVALMHMNNEPEAPRKINPNIPVGLEQIVLRAMRKKPAYRYHSDAEIMHDLEQVRRDPTVTFKYDDVQFVDNSPTRFVNIGAAANTNNTVKLNDNPISDNSAAKKISMLYGDDEVEAPKSEYEVLTNSADDDDYYDDEPQKKSSVVPVLAGIASVMVVAIAIVLVVIFNAFNNTGESSGSVRCPLLVGTDYEEACDKYKSIKIIIDTYEHSEKYPLGTIIQQSEKEDKFLRKDLEVKVVVSLGEKTKNLPDVYSKTEDVAVGAIETFGLEYVLQYEHHATIPKGSVIRTEPKRGSEVTDDTKVTIIVSKGKEAVLVKVPDIVGISTEDAEKKLKSKGLKLGSITAVKSLMPQGFVVSQSVDANSDLAVGSKVNVTVSSGEIPSSAVFSVNFTVDAPTAEQYAEPTYRISATLGDTTHSYTEKQDAYVFSFSTHLENGTILVNIDGIPYQEWYFERDLEPKMTKQYALNER